MTPTNRGCRSECVYCQCFMMVTCMVSAHRETYYYLDQDGMEANVRLNGYNKKETDLKFQNFLQKNRSMRHVPTLKEFVDEVYRPNFMYGLAPSTIQNYEQYLKLNIFPFFDGMKMDEVTVNTVQEFYNWMAAAKKHGRKNNLNRCSIARIGGLTSRMFKVAYEMNLIHESPFKMTLLRNNGAPGKHHQALPDNEVDRVKRMVPFIPDKRQRLYMGLLVYTGMRKEEVLGLRWENVYLEKGYGEVCRVVIYPDKSKGIVRETTKTAYSTRTFLIPTPLKRLLEACNKKEGFVVHGETEEVPLSYSTYQRTYRKAFEFLGLSGKYTNHDWRSTFGTQLKESGMSSAMVADLMGHADTRMVETVYARSRHEGVMKQQNWVEKMNEKYDFTPSVAPENARKP